MGAWDSLVLVLLLLLLLLLVLVLEEAVSRQPSAISYQPNRLWRTGAWERGGHGSVGARVPYPLSK